MTTRNDGEAKDPEGSLGVDLGSIFPPPPTMDDIRREFDGSNNDSDDIDDDSDVKRRASDDDAIEAMPDGYARHKRTIGTPDEGDVRPKVREIRHTDSADDAASSLPPPMSPQKQTTREFSQSQDEEGQLQEDANGDDDDAAGSEAEPRWSRRRLVRMFGVLLCLVLILQGVIVALLVSGNLDGDSNSNDDGSNDKGDIDSPSSTPPPSDALTLTPTQAPIEYGTKFEPLDDKPGSKKLSDVSECSSCAQSVDLDVPFSFATGVEGDASVRSTDTIRIFSDGFVSMGANVGYVHVVQGRLDSEISGSDSNIFLLEIERGASGGDVATSTGSTSSSTSISTSTSASTSSSTYQESNNGVASQRPTKCVVVSWENISFEDRPQTKVNAQVTICSDGIVDVCWGEGSIDPDVRFTSGMYSSMGLTYYPATADGTTFESTGKNIPGAWPANQCHRFDQMSIQKTSAPTQSPTQSPTQFMTLSNTGDANGSSYSSIANTNGAVRLEFLSAQDEGTEELKLGGEFKWLGQYPSKEFLVLVDGRLDVRKCLPNIGDCGTIEVVGANLDATADGDVWVLDRTVLPSANPQTEAMYIISWEGLRFADHPEALPMVSAQAYLFQTGDIIICWADNVNADNFPSFRTSVTDLTSGCGETFPRKDPFRSDGTTLAGTWPSGQCRTFTSTHLCDRSPSSLRPTGLFDTDAPTGWVDDDLVTSDMYASQFISLGTYPESVRMGTLSNCDSCQEQLILPGNFAWLTKYPVDSITVFSNGRIEVEATSGEKGAIYVALSDWLRRAQNGEIWSRFMSDGVEVSWEDMELARGSEGHIISAKARLFLNGTVALCWGRGSAPPNVYIESGVFPNDPKFGSYPAIGFPFDRNGRSSPGTWPSQRCQTFFEKRQRASPPTPFPSPFPTPFVGNREFRPGPLIATPRGKISNEPNTRMLTQVSACDDCSQFVEIQPRLQWVGSSMQQAQTAWVDANGRVLIRHCGSIADGFEEDCGEILVAYMDLDPSSGGAIFLQENYGAGRPKSIVVSWEDVRVKDRPTSSTPQPEFFANFRVELFLNGTIQICWGEAFLPSSGISIDVGISDFINPANYPAANDYYYGTDGKLNIWPTNHCQAFVPAIASPGAITTAPAPAPTSAPTSTRTSTPTSAPTTSPFPSLEQLSCLPTRGQCAVGFTELSNAINDAAPGDTISVCGSFPVTLTLIVRQHNITICCHQPGECLLSGNSGLRQFVVQGSNFVMDGMVLGGGSVPESQRESSGGGNLLITSSGHHVIRNCWFDKGSAGQFENGGNVHVKGADRVTIENSSFTEGVAIHGGGLAIEDTPHVDIVNSMFDFNSAQGGGGLYVFMPTKATPLIAKIVGSAFWHNDALAGGGIFGLSFRTMLSLEVHYCRFESNSATRFGGAIVVRSDKSLKLDMSLNEGSNNVATNVCNDIYAIAGTSSCFDITETVLLPRTDDITNYPTQMPPGTSLSPSPTLSDTDVSSGMDEWISSARIASSDFDSLAGSSMPGSAVLSADGKRMLLAPRVRSGSIGNNFFQPGRPVASILRDSDSGWTLSEAAILYSSPDYGNSQYDFSGVQADFARQSQSRAIVRFPRYANSNGPNIGVAHLYACCSTAGAPEAWQRVWTFGGLVPTTTVEYVTIADLEPFFVMKILDDTQASSSVFRIYTMIGDSTVRQIGEDIPSGSVAPSLFLNSAAISSDGARIALGVQNDRGCNQVSIYNRDGDTYRKDPFDIEFEDEVCFGNVLESYNMAMSRDGQRIAIALISGGPLDIYAWNTDVTSWVQLGNRLWGTTSFGASISFDGDAVAIGEPEYTTQSGVVGKVSVYAYRDWDWIKITDDLHGTQEGQRFGSKVELSAAGTRLLVASESSFGFFTEVFDLHRVN